MASNLLTAGKLLAAGQLLASHFLCSVCQAQPLLAERQRRLVHAAGWVLTEPHHARQQLCAIEKGQAELHLTSSGSGVSFSSQSGR